MGSGCVLWFYQVFGISPISRSVPSREYQNILLPGDKFHGKYATLLRWHFSHIGRDLSNFLLLFWSVSMFSCLSCSITHLCTKKYYITNLCTSREIQAVFKLLVLSISVFKSMILPRRTISTERNLAWQMLPKTFPDHPYAVLHSFH